MIKTIPPLGYFYLLKSFGALPAPDNTALPMLDDPNLQGILHRQSWSTLDPAGRGPDWSWIDAGIAACQAHNKLSTLEILAGASSPQWVFDLPGIQILNLTGKGPTTLPWCPVWQPVWAKVIQAMGERYDGLLSYVKLAQAGHGSESFIVNPKHPQDQIAADELARAAGYTDACAAWVEGVKWLMDEYAKYFEVTPFVLVGGAPFPDGGHEALQQAFDHGAATYPGRFGARFDDLTSTAPKDGEPSQTILSAISPDCIAVGYQMGNAQNQDDPNPPAKLLASFERGNANGAHFVEVFSKDGDDPRSASALSTGLEGMTGITVEETPPEETVPTITITIDPPGSAKVIVEGAEA